MTYTIKREGLTLELTDDEVESIFYAKVYNLAKEDVHYVLDNSARYEDVVFDKEHYERIIDTYYDDLLDFNSDNYVERIHDIVDTIL